MSAAEGFGRQWILASKVISRGYLVLGREAVIIGRAKDCTLPIFHDSVSRRHASVSRQGARFQVKDLGSTNGTFIQGKKIRVPHFLEHDQVVTVGSVELRFLALDASREELSARFDPRAAETSVVTPMSEAHSGALLSGQFTREVLLQVCQLIEVNNHSGLLRIEAGRTQGELRFQEGMIVGASFATFQGEKAARALLRLTSGEFAFKSGPREARTAGAVRLSAIALSLDILHEQDRRKSARESDGFLDRASPESGQGRIGAADSTLSLTRKLPRQQPPAGER